jgi:hypothetical protein
METEAQSGFFPSINQFRSVVKAEREWAAYHNVSPRKRRFLGTVKLHGTNAGITLTKAGDILYRSRTRIITPDDDNYGFALAMSVHESDIRAALLPYAKDGDVTVFGEWCGAGIQSNVGVSALEKMLVVFAMRIGTEWQEACHVGGFSLALARIFNVHNFPHWALEIDFSQPEQYQNELVALTEDVERSCPVAKQFGYDGIGEGIVWMPLEGDKNSRYWFKVKGEKHSASKVKVLAAVDVERFAKRDELVASLVTENRLAQGLDLHVNEFGRVIEMRDIGEFLRWVFNDIIKEEADTISASGFEVKELGKPVSDIAKRFFIEACRNA